MLRTTLAALLAVPLLAQPAHATLISFEDRTGPTGFGAPSQTLVYTFGSLTVTLAGGTVLTHTVGLPADQTSVYGSFLGLNANPVTITFSEAVSALSFTLLNGIYADALYTIADNEGYSDSVWLPSGGEGGSQRISLAAPGTRITVTAGTESGFWDFFLDNIRFDPPRQKVPEPASLLMIGIGLVGLGVLPRRR